MPLRRRTSRVLTLLATVGLLAPTLTSCTSDSAIQVYSARHYDLEQAFELFHEETGTDVEFLFGSDAELRERIAAEGKNTIADVYITVDAGNLAAAAEQGIFQPVQSETLDRAVPQGLRDPKGRWYALAKRVRTIIYAPDRVSPGDLSTYAALAEPQWKGRLCLRSATASYTQSLVAAMLAENGEAETERIVKGWADNARIFSNDAEIIENVASGNCEVAIVNHYYLARKLRDKPDLPVELFWADQDSGGVHVNISGGGVVAESDNPEGGQQLLEWLATDGQAELVGDNLEYPVNPEVEMEELLASWGDFEEQKLDATAYADRNSDAVALLGRVGYE
ncbi:MAG: Fe(3+) ABC transporter substrate-binding protein [Micrococcales bacterium]|nr:MAG: Fe(3+) ABC transporter substrate-binding protein [Micrococcales bacterium]PIE26088.1 MAG: Fe(3+) ABC transporter substrate-binding protein [Micrococcales bacterium]